MPDLAFCPAVSRKGWHCETAEHPGNVHYTWRNGWLTAWMALPGDSERWSNQASSAGVLDEAPLSLRYVADPSVPPDEIQVRDDETGRVLTTIYLKE